MQKYLSWWSIFNNPFSCLLFLSTSPFGSIWWFEFWTWKNAEENTRIWLFSNLQRYSSHQQPWPHPVGSMYIFTSFSCFFMVNVGTVNLCIYVCNTWILWANMTRNTSLHEQKLRWVLKEQRIAAHLVGCLLRRPVKPLAMSCIRCSAGCGCIGYSYSSNSAKHPGDFNRVKEYIDNGQVHHVVFQMGVSKNMGKPPNHPIY